MGDLKKRHIEQVLLEIRKGRVSDLGNLKKQRIGQVLLESGRGEFPGYGV